MSWLDVVAYFFGGVFAANGVPHFVSGVTGRGFQTPFAKPPGEGLSTSTVNVTWGFVNGVLAYLLVAHVGDFHLRAWRDVVPFGVGVLAISLFAAKHFGRLHGGDSPGPV